MTPRPDQRRSPRILELPTGKTVEVSYFTADGSAVRRRPEEVPPALDLHHCPACVSDLVYPTDWADADDRAYELTLRCPNCEWTEVGTFDQAGTGRQLPSRTYPTDGVALAGTFNAVAGDVLALRCVTSGASDAIIQDARIVIERLPSQAS